MANEFKKEYPGQTVEIDFADPVLDVDDFSDGMRAILANMFAQVPLTEFTLEPAGTADHWTYAWETGDGRAWRQDLVIASGAAMVMDWGDITGYWAVTDFADHRKLRDLAELAVRELGVTKIVVTWA